MPATKATNVAWSTLAAAVDTLNGCKLMAGEEKALTLEERAELNRLLRQVDDLACKAYDVATRGKARFALATAGK